MNKLILFHFIFLAPALLYSQDEDSGIYSHFFSLGCLNSQLKENIFLPKINRGPGIEASYRFENEKSNYNEITFTAGYSKIKTKLETERVAYYIQMDAGYSWGKCIISGEKIKYYLGAEATYHWSVMEYPVWDESRAYWSSAMSAGLFNRIELFFKNGNTLNSSLGFDFAGFCSRPDDIRLYAQEEWTFSNIMKITNSGFSFNTISDFFICSLRNEYRMGIKKGICFSLYNSVTYSKIAENNGESLQRISIGFGIGLGF